jgi:hypothetical protein
MRRIQRKRTKGWRMPSNTIYVGRPHYYGNPFVIGNSSNTDYSCYDGIPHTITNTAQKAVDNYEFWLKNTADGQSVILRAKNELLGKNLACWCPLNKPCHADVLIDVLNTVNSTQND